MKVNPIMAPVAGERVVGIHPDIEAYPEESWRRRLNNFSGRSLTHTALHAEQVWRSGLIAVAGQLRSAGIISGLEADIEYPVSQAEPGGDASSEDTVTADGSDRPESKIGPRVHVSPGAGLTAGGEMIRVTRPVSISWSNLFVIDHSGQSAQTASRGAADQNYAVNLPTLGERKQDGHSSPRAGVLVLEPVYTGVNRSADEDDQCELDPADFAYENWQLVDAARLALYTWPDDWLPLPAQSLFAGEADQPDAQMRNRIAFNIFFKERYNAIGRLHPWEKAGVPIALLGMDDTWQPLFIDRNAVVRSGGKRRRTESVLPDIGNRFLWQAQFLQFNEHLAELVTRAAEDEAVVDTAEIAVNAAEAAFRYLPPVGILPKAFMEPRAGTQRFFPLSYHVEAIAVPYEQLDVVVRESAPLLPFDIQTPDRVQILVPAPQENFESDLLKVETIDSEFDETVRRFSQERDLWLGRRLDVRRKASALNKAVTGESLVFASPDPDAVDSLELAQPFEQAVIELGDTWRYFKGETAPPLQWAADGFDDGQWLSGPAGFGFGQGRHETELADMQSGYVAIFCRKTFHLENNERQNPFKLVVTTNGGFTAYLNGEEIHRHNMTDTGFASPATAPIRLVPIEIDLSDQRDNLRDGVNLIAIQAHTHDVDATSFEFSPRLLTKTFGADIGEDTFGTELVTGDGNLPELDAAWQPAYRVKALDMLAEYLRSPQSPLTDSEVEELVEEGVEEFIELLQQKVDAANDRIDFGFLRLQTDIYRVRQSVLGNVEATRLATSPVLATIAKGDTAYATRKELSDYLDEIKRPPPTTAGGAPGGAPPEVPPGEGTRSADIPEQPPPSGSRPPAQPSVPAPTGVRISAAPAMVSSDVRGVRGGSADIFISGDIPSATRTSRGVGVITSGTPTTGIGGIRTTTGPSDLLSTAADPSKSSAFSTKTIVSRESAGISALFRAAEPTKDDIQEQKPIVGATEEFRHATVAERLEEPVASNTKAAGVATKASIINDILDVGINVDDIKVPGFRDENDADIPETTFADIKTQGLVSEILSGKHDKNTGETDDEAAYFTAGVRALENSAVVLRKIEGRVQAYKRAIARCRATLADLKGFLNQADGRLKRIADELAESRHDVTVARALKAEEQARVDAINERRDMVIAEHVPYYVFRRPRLTDTLIATPVHALEPDLSEAPLPVCEADPDETPQEISAMLNVLREAPLKWFSVSKRLLVRLNRLSDLRIALQSAKMRVNARSTAHPLLSSGYTSLNRLGQGIGKALFASQQLVMIERKQTAAMDLIALNRLGWNETAARAKEVLSLGDLIDGSHGRMGASRAAAAELDQIERIATCLYLRFGQVLPSIRLDWAERLSQFDAPLNLRNLYSLPRWGEVDTIERREIQMLADWLYQRVDAAQSRAVGLISDLVRICILLASHAPVNKIIAGRIPEPVTVRVGSRIDITADLSRVRIGQNVMVQARGRTVARATIDDITDGRVSASVLTTVSETLTLEEDTKVQIGEPRSIGGRQINTAHAGLLSMPGLSTIRF